MAVTVVRNYYSNGQPADLDVYKEATLISVDEGHLTVKAPNPGSDRSTVIAIYAPNTWKHVSKDDHAEYSKGE